MLGRFVAARDEEGMHTKVVRRTISLTDDLDLRIRDLAVANGRSYSSTVTDLLEEKLDDVLPYAGTGKGPRDLSKNAERYLDRQVRERAR